MDEKQQELMFKLQMFEQQIKQVQEQMQAVEQGIVDMTDLALGLEDMQGKKGEEILASVGKGIFVRTKLLSEELTVDVGGKNFVKKKIPDTVKVIRDQIKKLEKAKENLESQMDEIKSELEKTMAEGSK
jgi:prefoldin alpha subunit